MGFELYDRTVEATSELSWKEFATALMMELMALAVLVVLAIISVNLLLLLAASWILLYAGVFFLGFGGSRWTSDMAINYYKSILGIASQLLSMVLIVAIGKQFLLDYHNKISENMASQELAVMLVISLCLLFLVNKVPPMISGLVSGGNIGTMGIGSFGAGAAMGTVMTAASMGAAGMKIAGGAIASGAANATSGISAIKAAFEQAQSSMADGSMPSGGSETTQNRSGGSNTDSGDSPFSKAAGFDGTDRSSVSTKNRTKDADSSIRDDMAEFSDNALSGGDKHSMNQSTTDNDEVSDFVNRNKSDK